MIVLPQRFLYSMGAGAATVALLAAAAALFATPAMLALLGERVNALSLRHVAAAAVRHRAVGSASRRWSCGVRCSVAVAVTRRAPGGGAAARARHARPARQPVRAGGPRRAHGDRRHRRRVHAEPRLADHAPPCREPMRRACASEIGAARRRAGGVAAAAARRRPARCCEATPVDEPLSAAAQDTARSIRSIAAGWRAAWAARAPSSSTSSRAWWTTPRSSLGWSRRARSSCSSC